MTFSISNFNNLVEMTDGGVNYGISMLRDFVPTVILNIANLKPNFTQNFLILPNFNVSTYLPSAYLDFGTFGVALINILIAILGMLLYKMYNNNSNIRNRLLYSVFLHNIVFLFFNNMFLYLPIIVQYIYICIIFSDDKKKLKEEYVSSGKRENICNNSYV